MQTTETTTDVVTAARATIFARMIHGLTADGDARPAFEQAKDFDRYKVTKFVDATRYTAIPAWRVFGTSRSGRIAAGTPSRRE